MYVSLVYYAGALGLGQDEVEEEEEANVCVEGDPGREMWLATGGWRGSGAAL